MKVMRFIGFVLAGGLLFTSAAAVAETGAEAPKELALRKIMKDLGANMQTVAGAISMEDWPLIEKTAPLIADHPQPPMTEKLRIMAFIGTDMGKFKSYDTKVHEAADTLGQAAKRGDGEGRHRGLQLGPDRVLRLPQRLPEAVFAAFLRDPLSGFSSDSIFLLYQKL